MLSTLGIHESVNVVFPPEPLRDALDDLDLEVRVVSTGDLGGCDALVTLAYDESFLSSDIEWIHSIQAGVDRFPFEDLKAAGIRLTNSTGIHGDTVGETVAGYMLSFARQLHHYRDRQHETEWSPRGWDVPYSVAGSTVCVVGLGTLGRGVATRANALDMDVVGVKRTPTPVDSVETVHPARNLETAIEDAKFVVLTVPLTDETEGLIGRPELSAMRDDAILINVARGAVVDQDALTDTLERDEIGGAALDVFEEEPLPPESPLWEMDTVIVTPHIAAATGEYYRRVETLVRENISRYEAGESLGNAVI